MDLFGSISKTVSDLGGALITGLVPPPVCKPCNGSGGTLGNIAPQRIQQPRPPQPQQPQPPYRLGKFGHDLNFERREPNYILDNSAVRHELRKQAAEAVSQQSASFYMAQDAYLRSQQDARNMQMPMLPVKFS